MVLTLGAMSARFAELVRDGIDPKRIAEEIDALANRYNMSTEDRVSVMIAVGMLQRTPREGSMFHKIASEG